MGETLLEIRGLKTHFKTDDGMVRAVDGVDLTIGRGETLGVVGESGCGKTVTAMTVLKLIAMPPGKIVEGRILWKGRDLVPLDPHEMRRIRSREIAIVFQEPMTSLNPVYTVGEQIAEVVRLHQGLNRREAMDRAVEMLRLVHVPAPERRVRDYPHQLSGGMRQRVMIAMALVCSPELLIADEPTTALDVTIQAQILDLLGEMKSRFGMAIMLITHAMGVVAETAERVAVMYAGRVVEEAAVDDLFARPLHPYTQGLIRSIPRLDRTGGKKRRLEAIAGTVPSLLDPPPGCRFAPRCTLAIGRLHRRCRRCARSKATTRSPASSIDSAWRDHDRTAAARQQSGEEFPGAGRRARRCARAGARGRRRQLRDRRRRDAGAGRRIRLRQIDHWALHPAADRADLGRGMARRPQRHRDSRARRSARCAAICRSSSRTRSPR